MLFNRLTKYNLVTFGLRNFAERNKASPGIFRPGRRIAGYGEISLKYLYCARSFTCINGKGLASIFQ